MGQKQYPIAERLFLPINSRVMYSWLPPEALFPSSNTPSQPFLNSLQNGKPAVIGNSDDKDKKTTPTVLPTLRKS